MPVAHAIAQESHTGTTGSASQASFDWSVQFTAARRGLWVAVFALSASDFATSVKIDPTGANTDVPAVPGGFAADVAGEPRSVKLFFLGSGLPSVTTNVRVNRTNNATVMYAIACLVTADTDTEIYLPGIVLLEGDGTLAVQSVDDGSTGVNSVRYAVLASALNSVPAAGSGSTSLISIDLGVDVFAAVRETAAGQGARNVGFSSGTSDDRAAVHFPVRELFVDLPNEGTADGTIGWAGAATGTSVHAGAGSGAVAWVGAATGEAPAVAIPNGEATGTIGWAGTTTGTTTRSGEPTGSVTWAGSVTGVTIHQGAVTGTLGWSGTATGTVDREGASTGSITWTGTATGESPGVGVQEGSADGTLTWAGTAVGTVAHEGSATGTFDWAGTADGVADYAGAAVGSVTWVGEATSIVGPPPRQRLEASGLGVGWEGSPISTGLEGSSI